MKATIKEKKAVPLSGTVGHETNGIETATHNTGNIHLISWLKLMRSEDARELMAEPLAFTLLALIAYRAQRSSSFNRHDLEPGQAFLGDYNASGMSEQQYRTAKSKLLEWGFATFKATNKGTIATLTNTRVFDINAEPINGQKNSPTTDKQRTSNGQVTTTNNLTSKELKKTIPLRGVAVNERLTPAQLEVAFRFEKAFGKQWGAFNRYKWMMRIREDINKCRRVIADVEDKAKRNEIKTTPAQYAEYDWDEFK
jgi:hypothetical protein